MEKRHLVMELVARHELIANFVSRNLKQRYKGSFFGFLWSLLHPLLLILVYLVFIRLMRFEMDLPYLIVGVLVWQFFALASGDAVGIIYGHATLVKKTWFPRIILPLSAVIGMLIHFLLSLIILLFFLASFRIWPGPEYLHLLWLIPAQFLLCLGMSLLLSSLNVFYRDVEHILQILLMAWFFVTPIIYPVTSVLNHPSLPGYTKRLYFFNPMTSLVQYYREVFLGAAPPGVPVWPGLAVAGVILFAGLYSFLRLEPRFADEL
jgi:lipopolysaccharide transport system permease protein